MTKTFKPITLYKIDHHINFGSIY